MFSFINIVKAAIVPCGPKEQGFAEECGAEQFWELLHNLVDFAIYAAILIVGVAVAYGGFMVLISAGSQEKVSKGHKAITASIWGLGIVLLAWLVVNTIITLLTDCSGWNIFGEFKCS